MGNIIKACCCWRRQNKNTDIVILLAGLDNAGKTRTVGLLSGSNSESEAPTVGFHPARLIYRRRIVHLHDVGGGHQFRRAWRHYYPDAHGVIFVVDSADHLRLQECAQVLEEILAHPFISGKPVLILANKQDLVGAMDDLDIVENLNIETIVNRYKCPTRVESYTASIPKGKTIKPSLDPGLKKGYEWLLNYIIHRYDEINERVREDIVTQMEMENKPQKEELTTGFENPNYKIDIISKDSQNDEGIIIVQQANGAVDDQNLSPLFGARQVIEPSNMNTIELEARTHMRKLSPINRKKMFLKSDSNSSDSNLKEAKKSHHGSANEIFAKQLKEFKSQDSLNDRVEVKSITDENIDSNLSRNKARLTEVSLGDVTNSPVRLLSGTKSEINKTILPPIKLTNKILSPKRDSKPELNSKSDLNNRPLSASGSVRMQLESANILKRKLSFKGLRRNKTDPEDDTSLFIFDPDNKAESPSKKINNADIVVHNEVF